jgi:hypothetical protein
VRPCGVPPAALADPAPPRYVIDNRCGVIDPANSCRCWRHISSSEQAGILDRRHLPLRRHARCAVRVWIKPAAKRALDTVVTIDDLYGFDRCAGPAKAWDGAAATVPRTRAFVLVASALKEEPASGSRWRLQRARPSGAGETSPVVSTPVTIARRHGFEHVSIRRIHPGAQTLDIQVNGRPSAAPWCTSSTPPAEGITSASTKAGFVGTSSPAGTPPTSPATTSSLVCPSSTRRSVPWAAPSSKRATRDSAGARWRTRPATCPVPAHTRPGRVGYEPARRRSADAHPCGRHLHRARNAGAATLGNHRDRPRGHPRTHPRTAVARSAAFPTVSEVWLHLLEAYGL